MLPAFPRFLDRYIPPTGAAVGPRVSSFPFASAQTPDGYPREHRQTYLCPRRDYLPRLHQRTSYSSGLTYTDDPSNAAWSKTNTTGTANVVANPADGAVTAGRLLETVTSGEHKASRSYTFTATSHAIQFFARALGRDWIRILANDGTEDFEGWVNLATGATKPFADIINATTLNGSFETAGGGGADVFADWTESTSGTSTITRDTSVYYSGSASCKFTLDGSASVCSLTSAAVLQVGRRYRARFYARNSGSGTVLPYCGGQLSTPVLTTSFAAYEVDFIADATTFLFFCQDTAGAQVWIDGLELVPLSGVAALSSATLNGGFETAGGGGADVFANWTESTSGTSTITRDTSVYFSGAASCKFTLDGSASVCSLTSAAVLQVGRRYRARFYARNSGSGTVLPYCGGQLSTPALTTSFAAHEVDFTASNATFLFFCQDTAGAQVWIDNVTLTPLDLPTISLTACPDSPAGDWWRVALVCPWVRAAAGTVTLALSSDGTTLSYAGDTAKGLYLKWLNIRPGTATTLGPAVDALGTVRTMSAPDLDDDDPFAYLAAESDPQPQAGDLVRVERTFARIPGTQTRRDYQTFNRPNPSGRRSSTTYAANVDGDESFRLWTARKSVLGYQNTPGGTSSNTLPSGNITITLSSGHSATFAANAGQASIQSTINSNIVGVGKLLACAVSWSSSIVTFWLTYYVGGATVSSFSVPSGTTPEQTSSYLRATAFGTTITPDTKLVHCPSHGGAAGELVALWNGHILVARGTVAASSSADYLSLVLSDLDSPDFNFSALTLGDDATVRYASGAAMINVSIAIDYCLPGVTMLADGTTMASLTSLPAVTTYASEQRWLDRIVAAATSVPIDATQLDTYLGPIVSRATVTALMDDKALESLTLT